MGRKKRKSVRPWCWYCNREFDDEAVLIQHQKARHFKCHICHKKLFTGPGLAIHCMQVHKENIDSIPNALDKRNDPDIEIYGMKGIPIEDMMRHQRDQNNKNGGGAKRARNDSDSSDSSDSDDDGPGNAFNPMMMMQMMGQMQNRGMNPEAMQGMMGGMAQNPMMNMMQMMQQRMAAPGTNEPPRASRFSSEPGQARPLFAAGGQGGASSPSSAAPPPLPTGRVQPPPSKNTKIMHPEEDISLEELKARKYQHLADRSGPVQFNFSMKQQQQHHQQQQQSEELPPQNNYQQLSSAVAGAFDGAPRQVRPMKGRLPVRGSRGGFGVRTGFGVRPRF